MPIWKRHGLISAGGIAAVFAGIAASVGPADAQTGPNVSVGKAPMLRVETTLNLAVPLKPAAALDEQTKQSDDARRAVYEMASRECAMLGQVFKAECRLQNLRVGSNVQDRRGTGADLIFVNGSATYELSPR